MKSWLVEDAGVAGQWDIALRDLDFALGLDANQDDAITWGEVKAKHADIAAYALSQLRLGAASAPCPSRAPGACRPSAYPTMAEQYGSFSVIQYGSSSASAVATRPA